MNSRIRLHGTGALLAAFATSCAPDAGAVRPQWTITLRTDAPVPDIADRVLVELTDARGELACAACRRVLEVGKPSAWPISFGVALTEAPLALRARMYLARDTGRLGEPQAGIGIDVRARLARGGGNAFVELGTACFGIVSSADSSCDPATGQLGAIRDAATSAPSLPMQPGAFGAVAPCPANPSRPDRACISGGLFLLRDSGSNTTEAQRQRAQLVQVASFELDRDEFTVGRYRALALVDPALPEPRVRTSDKSLSSQCSYLGKSDARADTMPLNCVTREQARRYCEADGARLTRDAEFVYVAGNGARGTDFPWGAQTDICNRAVLGRGPVGFELDRMEGSFECRQQRPNLRIGPLAVELAAAEGDNALGVRSLAGNLAEWSDDDFAVITAPCWRGTPFLRDPICRTAAHTPSKRGGSWLDPASTADSRYHESEASNAVLASTGFRCARSLSK